MAKIVDHNKRRRDILKKSIMLFCKVGYPDVTYNLIATHCGLSRTVLYKYFPSKRQIFDGVIELVTDELFDAIQKKINGFGKLTYYKRLCFVLEETIVQLSKNAMLLGVINEYLIGLRRAGEEVSRRVRRYTVKGKRIIGELIREGVASGEFHDVDVTMARDVLYSLLETTAFRLAITDSADLRKLKKLAKMVVSQMVIKNDKA